MTPTRTCGRQALRATYRVRDFTPRPAGRVIRWRLRAGSWRATRPIQCCHRTEQQDQRDAQERRPPCCGGLIGIGLARHGARNAGGERYRVAHTPQAALRCTLAAIAAALSRSLNAPTPQASPPPPRHDAARGCETVPGIGRKAGIGGRCSGQENKLDDRIRLVLQVGCSLCQDAGGSHGDLPAKRRANKKALFPCRAATALRASIHARSAGVS